MGERAATNGQAEWVTTAVLLLVMAGMYAALLLPDDTISWLLKEERPLEGVGALGLLACSILCLLLWRHDKRAGAPKWRVLALLALAFLFFVAFGEEISWGQRIFGFGTPESLEEVNDQAETNLHNLATGKANFLFNLFWLVMGVLIPLAALHKPTRRRLERLLPILPAALAVAFVANQVVIKVAEEIFDAHPSLYNGTKYSVEYGLYEIKESVIQVIFAAAFGLLYWRVRRQQRPEPDDVEARPESFVAAP
jgi:hypothetical protein